MNPHWQGKYEYTYPTGEKIENYRTETVARGHKVSIMLYY